MKIIVKYILIITATKPGRRTKTFPHRILDWEPQRPAETEREYLQKRKPKSDAALHSDSRVTRAIAWQSRVTRSDGGESRRL